MMLQKKHFSWICNIFYLKWAFRGPTLFEIGFYLILLAVNSPEVAKMQPALTPASASPAPLFFF